MLDCYIDDTKRNIVQTCKQGTCTTTGGKIAALLIGNLRRAVRNPFLNNTMICSKENKCKMLQRTGPDQGEVQGKVGEPSQAVGGHRFTKQHLLVHTKGTSVDWGYGHIAIVGRLCWHDKA